MELIKSNFPLRGVVESRVGGRSENQDYYGFRDTAIGTAVVVCDGMGGMQGGQVASMLAVNHILAVIENAPAEADTVDVLNHAIQHANNAILKAGSENPELYGMGTTVTALILSPQCATVAYVGDSRVYQLRKGKKHFRTFDHSMVFEMVKSGVLNEEQARLSDQSNVILKALGVFETIEADTFRLPYRKGDRFILCSDGFWGCMPEDDFIKHVGQGQEVGGTLESMANRVEAIGRNSGGNYDNLTAAIVDVNCNSLMKEKMSNTVKTIIGVLALLLVISLTLNIIYLPKAMSANKAQTEQTVSEKVEEQAVTPTVEMVEETPEEDTALDTVSQN